MKTDQKLCKTDRKNLYADCIETGPKIAENCAVCRAGPSVVALDFRN
jgi:hypothetical protein